ncbi:hypothetical protein MBSD_n2101 [Mizugakiibacter sediminis]|uniref:Aspartyl protease n=1 Tax=Mizugakiibacter sediminis TaxID=1475481 RepID=A0A0K8QQ24_9GAMM|nr:hypothetical protein [Mizugakiibacter sediminis]GAP66786.1 hypothetical protein MBSD_n2101 [Mizugakiibacter sediminis]
MRHALMRGAALLALTSAFAGGSHAAPVFVATLPFRDCNGLICFEARLDGAAPRTLILDTGNVRSWVLTDAARALGWQLATAHTADGKTVAGIYKAGAHRAALGAMAGDADFLAIDRAQFGALGIPCDGALTYTFFHDRVLQIDYPRHLLRISAVIDGPADAHARGTLQLITFGKHGPPILVGAPFTVDGHAVRAQIDTAYTGTLLVYDAAIAPLGLQALAAGAVPRHFPYTDGGVDMRAAHARSTGFAGVALDAEDATVYFPTPGVHQPDGLFEATVGNALFRHAVVTLDLHAMTLDVRPEPGAAAG